VVVEPSSWLSLGEQQPRPAPVRDLPDWMVSDTLGVLERRASATLRQTLRTDRPVSLELQELLADHRQKEVRWLAERCLDHIGEFSSMVAVLNDPGAKLVWPEYAQRLHVALARGPRQADKVRQAFLNEYGPEAADLFRMLCGFDEQGLRGGQAAMLIEHLDHQSLAFRRLSFWNLRKITGKGLFYQPEAAPAKRKMPVREWRHRLEAGRLWTAPSKEKARTAAPMPPGQAPSGSGS